jgi:hypothetical protein
VSDKGWEVVARFLVPEEAVGERLERLIDQLAKLAALEEPPLQLELSLEGPAPQDG